MRPKRTWLDQLNLLDEALPGQTVVELLGNRRLLIEHHSGVIQYTAQQIWIRVRFGTLKIYGENMRFCRIGCDRLIIAGKFKEIRLEEDK